MKKTANMMHNDIPHGYPLCIHSDCPMANNCLRQLAYRQHDRLGMYLNVVNPALCTRQADCPHYVSSKPVRFARGFTNFREKMFPKQYDQFMTLLIYHFGRNQYFKRRRGETVLPPEEQEIIKNALKKAGVTQKMEFDEYFEDIQWTPNP